jgi:hypothetical protein
MYKTRCRFVLSEHGRVMDSVLFKGYVMNNEASELLRIRFTFIRDFLCPCLFQFTLFDVHYYSVIN